MYILNKAYGQVGTDEIQMKCKRDEVNVEKSAKLTYCYGYGICTVVLEQNNHLSDVDVLVQ